MKKELLIYNLNMKLGIIIDSSAGLTKKEADERGWGFLPLHLYINGKEYIDGIDIQAKTYYSEIKLDDEVKTSASSPGEIMEILGKMSRENDHVIVYALSKGLSSQTNNIAMIARDLDNVHVVPSNNVGYAIVDACEKIEKMAKKKNVSFNDIIKEVEDIDQSIYGVAIPDTLKWLVKGGRVNNSVARMANLLKIIPLIKFENGQLDKFGKGRILKKALAKVATHFKEERPGCKYMIYSAQNKDIEELKEIIVEHIGTKEIEIKDFPPIIGNHIGPGVIAIISYKK